MNILNNWKKIFEFLNYKNIINLTYVSKTLNVFVKKDILELLPKFPDKFLINSIHLKELIKKGFKFSYDINVIIKYCKNIENFKFLLEFENISINVFFGIACKLDNLELIETIIQKDIGDRNQRLHKACFYGNLKIVELIIQKGANGWNEGLEGACSSGNPEIIEFLIQKGADDWNRGLDAACLSGNLEIVELMIQKGANDWNRGLYKACLSGNFKIIELLIQKGADDLYGALDVARLAENLEIVDLLIRKGAINPRYF